MARTRIGELLIKQGLITESQLQEALKTQNRQKGSRIGDRIDLDENGRTGVCVSKC